MALPFRFVSISSTSTSSAPSSRSRVETQTVAPSIGSSAASFSFPTTRARFPNRTVRRSLPPLPNEKRTSAASGASATSHELSTKTPAGLHDSPANDAGSSVSSA